MKKIVLTYGDINGIGVEILIKALNDLDLDKKDISIVGAKEVFDFYKINCGLELKKDYEFINVPISNDAFSIGKENKSSGEHCFNCLKKACEIVQTQLAKNIVTAPISKHVLNMAGYNYSGQTEILEHFLSRNGEKSEMLFVANEFKTLLLTRHIALNDISKKLDKNTVVNKIKCLNSTLEKYFSIKSPKIGVLALNPHAGENGLLGNEEISIISPAINELNKLGINTSGPLVPDAAFAQLGKMYFANQPLPFDCYVSMYHDQGLIPMKLLAGDYAVNTTIGLQSIRTSPSHGTAFDIAGKNIARHQSMKSAIELALKLA